MIDDRYVVLLHPPTSPIVAYGPFSLVIADKVAAVLRSSIADGGSEAFVTVNLIYPELKGMRGK
jgi:hypothetical protein